MLLTVFNPCSNTFSGFLSDWNERGWMVIHQGNLTSAYQIFFLFAFEEIPDVFLSSIVCIVLRWFDRSVAHYMVGVWIFYGTTLYTL